MRSFQERGVVVGSGGGGGGSSVGEAVVVVIVLDGGRDRRLPLVRFRPRRCSCCCCRGDPIVVGTSLALWLFWDASGIAMSSNQVVNKERD